MEEYRSSLRKEIIMKQLLFSSDGNWEGFILRITLGGIMLPHGLQKMFGLFGGYGFKSTVDFFTKSMNLPWLIAVLIVLAEFFGSALLLAGLGSRLCAIVFIVIMIGAIITTNYSNGLFMNWFGNQKGEGIEYHLLVIAICVTILLVGSGKFSIDQVITKL